MTRHQITDKKSGRRPPVFGLTGGIASGKDLAAVYFSELGLPVIDADQVSRDLTAPNTPGAIAVIKLLGSKFALPDGSPNRRALRAHIFANPQAKKKLEALLHPMIYEELKIRIERAACDLPSYVLLMSPILLETNQQKLCEKIIAIDTDRETRIRRAMKRDDMTRELTEAILNVQESNAERTRRPDYLLDNNGSRADLKSAVHVLHKQLLLAARKF